MKPKILFPVVFFLLLLNSLHAANPASIKQLINHKDWSFVENKGQLAPTLKGVSEGDIKYYSHEGNVHVFCKPGMVSFVFMKVDNEDYGISEATASRVETQNFASLHSRQPSGVGVQNFEPLHRKQAITTSRLDLILIGSNPNAQITASDQQEYFENYYTTGDANRGITNVHTYKTIIYKDIYPNIDMVLNTRKGQNMEYSFLVHSGGNVSDIKLHWLGMDKSIALENGGFKYENVLGSMEESAPNSFVAGEKVKSSFNKKGFNYSFTVDSYDKSKDLLIDPTLSWATYIGGSGDEEGLGVTTDVSGNVYLAGVTTSSNGIATTGAYQSTFAGGQWDVLLAKFNSTGAVLWATYYGGSDVDVANAISIDGSGKIYITGYTGSTSGVVTSGAFQSSFGGDYYDAYLAKFNSTGTLSWATYYGGNGFDLSFGVKNDVSGNAYIAGWTASTKGIATSGAYQTSYAGGTYDAFLAKFSSSGALSWGTYYGGSGNDGADGLSLDAANVYITGYTYSTSGIASSGANQTSYSGNIDAFLAKFSSSGNISWSTYYGGSGADQSEGICADGSGNIYITGKTTSSSGIASSGAYQSSYGGSSNYNAFLAKFGSAGAISWATYYGGGGPDVAEAVCLDAFGNLYITGLTTSSSDIATSGAYQSSIVSGNDASFLAKFAPAGSLSWATYFAGNKYDNGTAVCADGSGNVYMTGYTQSTSGLATSGAYQTSFGGGTYDGFLAKFSFPYQYDAGLVSVNNPSGSICAGSQSVKVTLENYGISNLTSDSIYWKVNGTAQTAIKWTGSLKYDSTATVIIGTYNFSSGSNTIVVWSKKPNGIKDSAPYNDTAKINFVVNALPAAAVISNTAICSGTAISIGFNPVTGSTYSWISSPSGFSSTSSNPSVSPSSATSYTLTETNSKGCVNSNSVTITVNALPAAAVISNIAICTGTAISIGASAVTGSTYSWSSSPSGFSSTLSNPSVTPTATTTYTINETNSNNCIKSNSVTITVNPIPAAAVISSTAICSGAAISIGASAVTGSSYSWSSSPSGFSSTLSNPSVSPTSTTSYTLTETNISGCKKSNSVTITVNPLPDASWIGGNVSKNYYFHVKDSSLAKSSYLWDFGDGSATTTGYSLIHVFPSNKTYTVKLKVTNANGCEAEVDSSIIVTISGIESHEMDNLNLSIFPNPFQTSTTISYNLTKSANIQIALFDITGKQIAIVANENQIAGNYLLDINAEKYHLQPGMYLLKFMMDGEYVSRSIVKF